MTAIRRTPAIGRVLAAGALLGLVGCQHTGHHPAGPKTLGLGNDGGKPITPAQEADVQITMGRVAEKQGDIEQAMAAYRAALSRDDHRADAHLRLAVIHDKQGKFRESAELYKKALALRPGDAEIFCDMGYSYYLQRRWAESEMNLRQAIALNPDLQRAHNNLAMLLVRDSRLDAAMIEFRKGGSDPVQAHLNLAFALTLDRRWEPARENYERALALDPSCELAKDRLAQLNTLLAKLEKPRDGGPRDAQVLTTSTSAKQSARPPANPTLPVPSQNSPPPPALAPETAPVPAVAIPPQAARPRATRDPGLVTTSARVDSSRRLPRTRVPIPRLPAEASSRQAWSVPDYGYATGAARRPAPVPAAPQARPDQPTARLQAEPSPAQTPSGVWLDVDTIGQPPVGPASKPTRSAAPLPRSADSLVKDASQPPRSTSVQ